MNEVYYNYFNSIYTQHMTLGNITEEYQLLKYLYIVFIIFRNGEGHIVKNGFQCYELKLK